MWFMDVKTPCLTDSSVSFCYHGEHGIQLSQTEHLIGWRADIGISCSRSFTQWRLCSTRAVAMDSQTGIYLVFYGPCVSELYRLSVHNVVPGLTVNTVFSPCLIGWGRWGTWVFCTESHVGKTPSSFHPLPHCLSLSVSVSVRSCWSTQLWPDIARNAQAFRVPPLFFYYLLSSPVLCHPVPSSSFHYHHLTIYNFFLPCPYSSSVLTYLLLFPTLFSFVNIIGFIKSSIFPFLSCSVFLSYYIQCFPIPFLSDPSPSHSILSLSFQSYPSTIYFSLHQFSSSHYYLFFKPSI